MSRQNAVLQGASAADRIAAITRMDSTQRRNALRPALPAGTRIYAVETMTFSVGGDLFVFPTSQIVAIDGSNVRYRRLDGTIATLQDARLVRRDYSQEVVVRPGHPLPASLAGQTPEHVIR
jgi:hypothetical protein